MTNWTQFSFSVIFSHIKTIFKFKYTFIFFFPSLTSFKILFSYLLNLKFFINKQIKGSYNYNLTPPKNTKKAK